MISITKLSTDKEAYFLGSFLIDFGVGIVAMIATIPAAVFLGGFSFFVPWLIINASLMFAAGVLRGNSAGNAWAKGISLNLSCLLVLGLLLSAHLTLLLQLPVGVLPAVAGISFKRHRLLRSTQRNEDS